MQFSQLKFPIMIIAAPRTGSNLLTAYLKQHYNLTTFVEPNRKLDERQLAYKNVKVPSVNDILEFDKQSNKYLVKVHGKDFFHADLGYDQLDLKKYYLVRIRRQDLVGRIVSYYTALIRGIWNYNKNNMVYVDSAVIIDIEKIKKTIRYIVAMNYLTDNFEYHMNVKFDQDVVYEDFVTNPSIDLSTGYMARTPKPINYDELRLIVQTELQSHLSNWP
jgi:hypothetical protein